MSVPVAGPAAARVRSRVRVEGTVQGVGFRPFVYRLALEEGLGGHVQNDARGVLAEVEGPAAAVTRFVARLSADAPPLAVVRRVNLEAVAPCGERDFRIVASARAGVPDAAVAPDSATCAECLAELFDPADRRYRYPFTNCTDCGPRFTIVRGVPYDRELTTMARFRMCAECRLEYDDPGDRRFHAQPNACPRCGPSVVLTDAAGRPADLGAAVDAVAAAARRLAAGAIVAVKGIGGYHLACDAADEAAVAALRARKHREHRPFALMAADTRAARRLVELGAAEERLLGSAARPIVLAPRRAGAPVAAAVAPRAPELGVMLPYSPLHHVLLADLARAGTSAVLVMTSGNVSDEPIAYRDADALQRLTPIADFVLQHDRPIQSRTDDSVVRVVRRRPVMLRRSRGHVPESLELPVAARRPVLACGAEQKNTFCLARGSRAWVGHHIGDLEHLSALEAYQEGVTHFERLFAVEPELVAHDLHPDYLSTAYALERPGVELVGVQHHHAHLAACLAEHGLTGPAVGAIYDGTGYGLDATVWGGEVLVGGLTGFERAACLRTVRMPGGAAAVREPWRMACAWLADAVGEPQPLPGGLAGSVAEDRWRAVASLGASAEVSPQTSSMGRLFDAVGALCGLCAEAAYEGQAAVELESAAAASGASVAYEIEVAAGGAGLPGLVLDPRIAVRAIVADLAAGVPVAAVAAGFHAAVADATAAACLRVASEHGIDLVVLSGGVFQNRLLLEATAAAIEAGGLAVLVPERLPPNDGGISFGQAAVAAALSGGAA
jgi:hydrogenase maturation protein HypF